MQNTNVFYNGVVKDKLQELSRQETPNSGGGAKGDENSGGDDDDDETQMRAHVRAHIWEHMKAHI